MTTLFALASRQVSRGWFRLNLLLVLVMLLGSVVTGYHYLVDGWGGILLALGTWFLGRLMYEPISVARGLPLAGSPDHGQNASAVIRPRRTGYLASFVIEACLAIQLLVIVRLLASHQLGLGVTAASSERSSSLTCPRSGFGSCGRLHITASIPI